MPGFARSLTAIAVAASLCAVSTAAIAAAPAPVAASPVAAAAAPSNPWLTLSAMTTSSSAASAAAAAQNDNDGLSFPPWPALAVILATIGVGIYILVKDDNGHLDFNLPVSPF